MGYPTDRRYTNDHEWAMRRDGSVVVGITDHAQEALGEIVYAEMTAAPGQTVSKGQALGTVESTKAVSDVFSPVSGRVAEVNGALSDSPATINKDPHGAGWMARVEPSDPAEYDALMTAAQYEKLLADSAH